MSLDDVAKEIEVCRKCPLHRTRINPVPGEGNENARIMFIGEAPGGNEDLMGRPFVGRAGKLLDLLLETIGLKREDVFITNVVKCRPPGNRDPTKEEIEACHYYLDKQISIIRPKVICTLGRFSMDYILNKFNIPHASITESHGKVFEVKNLSGKFFIIPMYHPAAALYNPNLRGVLEEDFKTLKDVLEKVNGRDVI